MTTREAQGTRPHRIARIAVGVALIAVAALAIVWLVTRDFPGDPRAPQTEEPVTLAQVKNSGTTQYPALSVKDVVEVPAGESFVLEGITDGKYFTYTAEALAELDQDDLALWVAEEGYIREHGPLSVTVTGARVLSIDAFLEFYGIPQNDFIAYSLPDNWNKIGAHETLTRIEPFLVETSACEDPTSLRLQFIDCDTETVYRFAIPDVECAVPSAAAQS